MQQYTRQQLIGHVRYMPHCLMGNWSEETELKRTVLKDFMLKKETGSLQLDRYNERMSIALAEAELTRVCDDGNVHFGDLLQLVHAASGAALCVDVEERDLRPAEKAVGATASPEVTAPVARNTFIIAKYVPAVPSAYDVPFPDDVLRYGQKIRLLANPEAQAEPLDAAGGARPLALFSKPISTTHFAKYSRHQVTGFTWRQSTYDSVWQVVTPDPSQRVASEGIEVAAGAPLLLVHAATQQALCLEGPKRNVPNDFGFEHEVTAHSDISPAMVSMMEFGASGLVTKTLRKPEASPNQWCFLAGSRVAALPPPAPPAPTSTACWRRWPSSWRT